MRNRVQKGKYKQGHATLLKGRLEKEERKLLGQGENKRKRTIK